VSGSINGLNLAIGGLAAVVVTPFMPRAMAKIGAAELLALALVIAAAALIAIYAIPSLWLWFPVRFVLSSALNALFVIAEYWISRLANESNRGRYIALYSLCFAGGFGIGPALLQVTGTNGIAPFAAGAVLLLAAIAPVMFARRAAPRIEQAFTTSVVSVVRAAPAAFAAAFVFGAVDAGMAGLIPVYAMRSGYTEAHAALCVTAMALGSIMFQYPIGALADRTSRRHLLALCAATGIVGAALTPLAVQTPYLLYLLLFVWGGLILGIYTIGLMLLGEHFCDADLANANASFVILYSLGLLLGPLGEGVALDAWNPDGLMLSLGLICAVYMGFLLAQRPEEG